MKWFRSEIEWKKVSSLINWTFTDNSTFKDGFECLYYTVFALPIEAFKMDRKISEISSFLCPINFEMFIGLIDKVISTNPNHLFVLKSLELLQYILNTVPTFYGVSVDDPLSLDKEDEVVKNYILPTLKIIRKACQDHRIAVHNNALACLQRALSPELYTLSTYNSVLILYEILFNLLTTLLEISPSKGGLTKDSLENIRLRAISILCKTFLQYMPKLIMLPSFKELWTKIMKYVQDYMNADNSELLVKLSQNYFY